MAANTGEEAHDHHRGREPLLRPTGPARTGTFLLINLAGFVAVNAFWQYLSTGQWMSFSPTEYHRGAVTPVADILVHPLNILTHPWMIVVIGLLLALLAAVPVLVAVLYRALFAAAFVAVLAVVGQAPLLAGAVAVGCVLAVLTRLRSDLPFIAALLGMVPVGLYLYAFAFGRVDSAAALPLQRWIFSTPFLVAVVSAVLAAAAVLALARMTGYRPGVVWPVLVFLLVGPAAVFYFKIGPAELEYALITNRLAPADPMFPPHTQEDWYRAHEAVGLNPQTLRIRVEDDLQRRKHELAAKCRAFLARRGDSRRAPAVAWVEAQCVSLQLDQPAFAAGEIKYTAAFLAPVSGRESEPDRREVRQAIDRCEAKWRQIIDRYAASPHAALAEWRLGELALRRAADPEAGDLDGLLRQADEHLHAAAEALREMMPVAADRWSWPGGSQGMDREDSIPSRRYYSEALFSVERLLWLMKENRVLTDQRSAKALAAYLSEDPYQQDYLKRLEVLAGRHEGTNMGHNLKLAVAQATPNLYERADALIVLAESDRADPDAAIEANYELGQLAMRTGEAPVIGLVEKLHSPEWYFRTVLRAPPGNPWQRLAAERLTWLRLTTRPKD